MLSERLAFSGHGGQGGDVVALKRGENFVFTGRDNRQAKDRTGGGAQGFLVPWADGAGQGDESGGSKGLGGADEGAEIAGVLQSGGNEEERRGLCAENILQ